MSGEDEKRRARAQAVGLFRYQLICPALDGGLSTKARGRLVREIASGEHTDPFGTPVRYSRDTLDRWIRRYRAGGFAELVPSPRTCVPRTDTATLEMAAALKRENPARTAAQVQRILRAAAGWAPSESTLLRLVHRCELMGPAAGGTGEVFGRFEAANPNDRWTGDALHGPRIGGRKTYLFAFLDDHSRLICGYRFGFAEDAVRLPQGRGKIERFFRTVREQFLVEIVDTTAEELTAAGTDHRRALLDLNRLFTAWVETEYHRRTHTETGQAPWERWSDGWSRLGRAAAMPTAADLTEAFLWSEYRTVTRTATVSLHGNTFEVDAALIGRRVELVFSPFDLETIEVRYREVSHGRAVPHIITRHTHPKARPETPEPPPSPATGIDYLALTAQNHHEQIRADHRIGYDALFTTLPAETGDGQKNLADLEEKDGVSA